MASGEVRLFGSVRVASLNHGNTKWKMGGIEVFYDVGTSEWVARALDQRGKASHMTWKVNHAVKVLLNNRILRIEFNGYDRGSFALKDWQSDPVPLAELLKKISAGNPPLVHPLSPRQTAVRQPLTPTRTTPQKVVSPSPSRRFTGYDLSMKEPGSIHSDGKENAEERRSVNKFLESSQQKSEETLRSALEGKKFYNKVLTSTPSYGHNLVGSLGMYSSRRKPGFLSNPETKRNRISQVDYSWKATPTYTSEKTTLQGFSNLGNTCYMNAILQSLFGLDSFYSDLLTLHRSTHGGASQEKRTLYTALACLLIAKKRTSTSNDKQRHLLANVKNAISASAKRFSGYEQHDAHEFLGQVLDQLKEEVIGINKLGLSPSVNPADPKVVTSDPSVAEIKVEEEETNKSPLEAQFNNPTLLNFEFEVQHTIQCLDCHGQVTKTECFHDLSLDMPHRKDSSVLPSIQDALDFFFQAEKIEYSCEQCPSKQSLVTHKFTRLPRVLVLHLKRYSFDMSVTYSHKVGRSVDIPKFLTLEPHCTDLTSPAFPPMALQQQLGNRPKFPVKVPVLKDPNDTPRRKLNFVKTSPVHDRHYKSSPIQDRQFKFKRQRSRVISDDEEELPEIKAVTPRKHRKSGSLVDLTQAEVDLSKLPEQELLEYVMEMSKKNADSASKKRKRPLTPEPQDSFTEQDLGKMTEEDMMQIALETSRREAAGECSPDRTSQANSDQTQFDASQGFSLPSEDSTDFGLVLPTEGLVGGQVDGLWDPLNTETDNCHISNGIIDSPVCECRHYSGKCVCRILGNKSVGSPSLGCQSCTESGHRCGAQNPVNVDCSYCDSVGESSCLACLGMQLDGQTDFSGNQGNNAANKSRECEELLNKSDTLSDMSTPHKRKTPKRSKISTKSPKDAANQPKINMFMSGQSKPKSRHKSAESSEESEVTGSGEETTAHSQSQDSDTISQSQDDALVSSDLSPTRQEPDSREVDYINNNTNVHDTQNNNRGACLDILEAADDQEEEMQISHNEPSTEAPDVSQSTQEASESDEETFVTIKTNKKRSSPVRETHTVAVTTEEEPSESNSEHEVRLVEDSPVRPTPRKLAAVTPVKREDPEWLTSRMDEDEQLRQALEASMQDQHQVIKLSSEEEISEEEQIRRATELSLQECHMPPPAAYDFDAMPVCQLERTEEDDRKLRENALTGRLPYSYRLMSVVSHLGSSSSAGHYVSDVYEIRKKQWLSYDDTHVSKTTELEVCRSRQRTGYIFFYLNKDVCTEIEDLYRQVEASHEVERPASR